MPAKDGLSRRVDALLDLLAAASMDTMDNQFLEREYSRCTMEMKKPTNPELPDSPQAWDKHIDKMIRQLRDAVRDTPENQQPEEPESEPLERQGSYRRGNGMTPPARDSYEYEPEELPEIPQEDRRQYLEREFSSTSYPKIGPGYSDSISVCSELTIPTVVAGMDVPEEEDYSRPSPILPPGIGMTLEFSNKPSRSSKGDSQRRAPPPVEQPKPKSRNKTASYSNAQSARRLTATDLRAPSLRIAARPPPLDAAQRRRQSHQATMAHLGEKPSALPAVGNPRAFVPTIKPATGMTVNDFPSLNESPNFFAPDEDDDAANGRRSLLRKPDKFSRDTPTASSRMLLSNQTTKSKKATKYGGIIGRRRSSTDEGGETAISAKAPTASTDKNFNLDGVLSTMGQDIDSIFRELTAQDELAPVKKHLPEIIRKQLPEIKKQLPDVSTAVKSKGIARKDGITGSGFKEMGGGWPSMDALPLKPAAKKDPLLIDEDGFIITADNSNPFGDPFAMQPMEPKRNDPFDTGFFPSTGRTPTTGKPKTSSKTKTSRRSSEVGPIPSKKKGSKSYD